MTDWILIDTQEGLDALVDDLHGQSWLTLDTEFMREKTYHPRLCLLQLASEDLVACIDPLAIDDLDPLFELIEDPAITKVLHAAHQDLEILHHLRGRVPENLFDTQIAATVLGQGEQVGYARLVENLLGRQLDKSQTRTDWCRRPLTRKQLGYAADDVRYLRDIYRLQLEALDRLGRHDWLTEDFARLSDPARYQVDPDRQWRRVKGMQKLRPRQRAILQQLAAWRERQALASNRPRRWILKDEPLLDLAMQAPEDRKELAAIRGLPEATVERHGDTLLDCIRQGRELPREDWPELPRRPHLDEHQQALVDLLMAVVRTQADRHEVNASVLVSRKDMERLVTGDRAIPLLEGWRLRVAGQSVEDLLAGEIALTVEEGRITALPRTDR